jgi:hypothetical protein
MAKQLDPKELVSFKEMLLNEVITSAAIINLLDKKGVISREELLEEIRRVHATMVKADK